jgi:hypothetical protein
MDGLIELLETELGRAEVVTAPFEFEPAGRMPQLPEKNYLRAF